MHVAAYESAHLSLAELVQGGANVDERTSVYRQQTPLQTALRFGTAQTVRTLLRLGADRLQKDNEGQDACAWARFWKRSEEVQRMVCE
jgi:ankyrin repeat protein